MHSLYKVCKTHVSVSLIGTLTNAALAFLTISILAKKLGPELFGEWMIWLTVYTLMEALRAGLIQTPLIKTMSETNHKTKLIGSAWLLGLSPGILVCIINIIVYMLGTIDRTIESQSLYAILLYSGPVLIVAFPFHLAQWLLQYEMKFLSIFWVRLFTQLGFLVYIFIIPAQSFNFLDLFATYALILCSASLICIFMGWAPLFFLFKANIYFTRKIFAFGKFSMGTMIGSNLLRSSDTIMIGIFLGPTAVAIYSLPLKLLEVLEIPLRAVINVLLPSLAKKFNSKRYDDMFKEFWLGIIGLTSIILFLSFLYVMFAETLLLAIGDEGYAESIVLLQLFCLFAFLLPFDRFSGVILDIINRPKYNFFKVILMLSVNIGGNLIALIVFDSFTFVAIVSMFTFSAGVIYGFIMIKKKSCFLLDFRHKQFNQIYKSILST